MPYRKIRYAYMRYVFLLLISHLSLSSLNPSVFSLPLSCDSLILTVLLSFTFSFTLSIVAYIIHPFHPLFYHISRILRSHWSVIDISYEIGCGLEVNEIFRHELKLNCCELTGYMLFVVSYKKKVKRRWSRVKRDNLEFKIH